MSKTKMLLLGVTLALASVVVPVDHMQDADAADDFNAPVANDGTLVQTIAAPRPTSIGPIPGNPAVTVTGTIGCETTSGVELTGVDPRFPRMPVADLAAFPNSTHVTIHNGPANFCTGWVISNNVVVTAGHCIHGGNQWGRLTGSYPMCVGFDVTTSGPSRYCGVRRLYSTNGWVNRHDERYDYGAIELNCNVGARVGKLGYGWTNTALTNRALSVSGYFAADGGYPPCTEPRITKLAYFLCRGFDRATLQSGGQLFYGRQTGVELGTSGAPAILTTHLPYAVAITTNRAHGADPTQPTAKFNYGVLISQHVFENLVAWSKAR
jgi:glutamyl endopeptidase